MSMQASQLMPGSPRWQWPAWPARWVGHGLWLILLAVILGMLVAHLAKPTTLPIRKIRVQGALVSVNEGMLRRAIAGKVRGGYFSVDVAAVRERVEELPWVRIATVRRAWPDAIVIRIVEQQPLACWAKGGLVNLEGEIFRPEAATCPPGLPLFSAPEGMHGTLAEQYRSFSELLARVDLRIAGLFMDARRSIRLKLENGMQLVLGREAQQQRLHRFVKVYAAKLAAYAAQIRRVDLRYSNGMAVQWRSQREQQG